MAPPSCTLRNATGRRLLAFLRQFDQVVDRIEIREHVRAYCRALLFDLSDLPRKSTKAIAEYAGIRPRTLQHFLPRAKWDSDRLLGAVQRHLIAVANGTEQDRGETIAILKETSIPKRGNKSPGVAKQYLESLGRINNGIVLLDLMAVRGSFAAHLDSRLLLPESWEHDHDRRRAADMPDSLHHRPTAEVALEILDRAAGQGWDFDLVLVDPSLTRDLSVCRALDASGWKFAAAASMQFHGRKLGDPLIRAAMLACGGQTVWITDPALGAAISWYSEGVTFDGGVSRFRMLPTLKGIIPGSLHAITNLSTDEVQRVLEMCRGTARQVQRLQSRPPEQAIRHYEGQSYVALMRHLTLCLIASAFMAIQEMRRR